MLRGFYLDFSRLLFLPFLTDISEAMNVKILNDVFTLFRSGVADFYRLKERRYNSLRDRLRFRANIETCLGHSDFHGQQSGWKMRWRCGVSVTRTLFAHSSAISPRVLNT